MQALERANDVRLARAYLKRQIAAGETTVQEILADPPPEIANMTIAELLLAQHRWGSQRMRQFLKALGISELRPVGRLTERERKVISYRLGMAPSEIRMAA